jgi:hypothetical protein
MMMANGAGRLAWTPVREDGLSTSVIADAIGGYGSMALAATLLLVATLCTVGWRTRWMVFLCWILVRALSDVSKTTRGAYDLLMIDAYFCLLLSGCGNTLSLDARRFGERTAWRFARLLVTVQITALYLGSALAKMSLSWLPHGHGDALWYVVQQPIWSRWRAPFPDGFYPVAVLLAKGAWLFEFTAPILLLAVVLEASGSRSRLARLFARLHIKQLYIISGLALHLGIEVLLDVGPFSFVSWSLYPCLVAPSTWTRWRARLTGWMRAQPTALSAAPAASSATPPAAS